MWRPFRIPSYRPPDELPSRGASNWLLVSVAFAVAPHALRNPVWLTLAVALGLAWRFGIDNHGWRLPPRWLRWLALVAVSIGILFTFGTFLGREAGLAFLAAATGLKVLEIRKLRDYLVTVFLAYFLILGAFLYEQTMFIAVYGITVALLTTASLARLNSDRGLSGGQVWKLVGRMLMFGAPICLVLYLFFPRIQGSLWALPQDAFSNRSGMTDQVHPGDITRLSRNTATAFRVEFSGPPPAPADRYWRVYVLSQPDDGGWRRSTMRAFDGAMPGDFTGTGPVTDYTVTLQAHNDYWLPALDWPLAAPALGEPRPGMLVRSGQRVNRVLRYSLSAREIAASEPLNVLEERHNLRMDREPSARLRRLIDTWREQPPAGRVDAALAYFREQPFRYTLTPPALAGRDIERFIFDTRAGYCEHFASAFVALMRWSGVPTRMVVGYQGGQWNEPGDYLTVTQADAHAWAEAWLPGQGWRRVDPTAAVAPERIELGAEAIRRLVDQGLEPGSISDSEIDRLMSLSGYQMLRLRAEWLWDNADYLWSVWVTGYGPEIQQGFMRALGFNTPSWSRMVATLAIGVAVLFALAALIVTRQRRRADRVVRLYHRALRRIARTGPEKAPQEGPRAFQQRLAREAPELARRFKPVTDMYIALRYGESARYTTPEFRILVARL